MSASLMDLLLVPVGGRNECQEAREVGQEGRRHQDEGGEATDPAAEGERAEVEEEEG